MQNKCPLCGKGTLKQNEQMVYCTGYQPQKDSKEWFGSGECDFHIPFKQKAFKKDLTASEIESIIDGNSIKNSSGDILKFRPICKGLLYKN